MKKVRIWHKTPRARAKLGLSKKVEMAKRKQMRAEAYSIKNMKVRRGLEYASTAPVPDLNSMLTRMTMMMMEMVQLPITLMNQHIQCIQLGSPISFISSFTPVSFSKTILFNIGGTMKENERTKKRGRINPSNNDRLLLK